MVRRNVVPAHRPADLHRGKAAVREAEKGDRFMDLSSRMILFAKVVERESFSAAARELGQTPSSVSRQIGHLEDQLHLRLLNRSSHGLSLTREGQEFYHAAADVASRVEDAERMALSASGHPSGVLRVASTVAFGKAQLIPILGEFLETYPEIRISLVLTDQRIDLVEEGIDIAIRFSEQIDQRAAIVRKIVRNRRVLCASPCYVARHGMPQSMAELANHNCLTLTTVPAWNDWARDSAGDVPVPALRGNFEADSADAIYRATLAGMGIARLSTYLVNDDLRSGKLVRVLPDYSGEESEIVAIYPERRNLVPRVRVFLDFLVGRFPSVPPWEMPA